MHGVDRPRELFRAINDLEPGRIKPGTKVKIVTDR
jgi:predicted Zn-dependent protease